MSTPLRIGTRDSELALWQAKTVQKQLENLGQKTTLIPVKSTGDLVLDKPLYELGITGIFTKTLDVALLKEEIDVAVHSLKDVPTQLPIGIVQAAVLQRADASDILVHKGLGFLEGHGTIATGSLRRKAQWLHRYPEHIVTDLRGNVNTRLQKLEDHSWNGAIFAKAGLERINLLPKNIWNLDWMIPAPAQGAMMIAAREKDTSITKIISSLNHKSTQLCTGIEREFLRTLEGGCTAPIGAYAELKNQTLFFKGALFSLDGSQKLEITKEVPESKAQDLGASCAREIIKRGGDTLLKEIKNALNSIN